MSEQYDACLDRLICAWTGVPTPPARVRVSTFTSFLASGLKDGGDGSRGSVLDQIRIQRVDEYGKHPFELHEWPGIVQLFVTTETGATTTAEFLDLNWSPSDRASPSPGAPAASTCPSTASVEVSRPLLVVVARRVMNPASEGAPAEGRGGGCGD